MKPAFYGVHVQGVTAEGADASVLPGSGPAAATSDGAGTAAAAGVGDLEVTTGPSTQAKQEQQQDQQQCEKQVVLLHGPPMAGTSTQAQLLAARYGIPTVTVDTLLHVSGACVMCICMGQRTARVSGLIAIKQTLCGCRLSGYRAIRTA